MQDELPFGAIDRGKSGAEDTSCVCAAAQSLGKILEAILDAEPQRTFGTKDLYIAGARGRHFCRLCTPRNILSLQLYHLRQSGVAEKIGIGRFRYRRSDTVSADFIYAKRARKE